MITKVLNNGGELPVYDSELSAGFDLKVTSFKRLFSGNKEVNISKLKTSIERGYFTLRGFERALVGTNLFLDLETVSKLQIRNKSNMFLERGLFVASNPIIISNKLGFELGIVAYNSTPFLNKLLLGEELAQAVLVPYIRTDFELVNELSL